MPSRWAHLPRWRAFLRTRLASMAMSVIAAGLYPGDAALTPDPVLQRDGAPAERRQLDRPGHQAAVVDRPRGDLRNLLTSRIARARQVGVGRRDLDLDLLDLGDRDPLGHHDLARHAAEVGHPDRDPDGLDVPAAKQAGVVALAGLGAVGADVGLRPEP